MGRKQSFAGGGECPIIHIPVSYIAYQIRVLLRVAHRSLQVVQQTLQVRSFLLPFISDCTGNAIDSFSAGRKPIFLAGIATFGIFVLIASFMRNEVGFFICRALSGIGAAMLSVSNAGTRRLLYVHSEDTDWCALQD